MLDIKTEADRIASHFLGHPLVKKSKVKHQVNQDVTAFFASMLRICWEVTLSSNTMHLAMQEAGAPFDEAVAKKSSSMASTRDGTWVVDFTLFPTLYINGEPAHLGEVMLVRKN